MQIPCNFPCVEPSLSGTYVIIIIFLIYVVVSISNFFFSFFVSDFTFRFGTVIQFYEIG